MQQYPERAIEPVEVSTSTTGGMAVMTVLAACFVVPFLYALLVSRTPDTATTAFLGVCSSIVLFAWVMAAKEAHRISGVVKRFGSVPLHIEGAEPSAGGRLTASIRFPETVTAQTVLAELVCKRVTHNVKRSPQWREVWARRPNVALREGVAQFSFDIPAWLSHSVPPPDKSSDIDINAEYWEWSLRVHAEIPGVDFDYTYPVTIGPAPPGTATAPPSDMLAAAPPPARRTSAPAQVLTTVAGPAAAMEPLQLPSIWALIAANALPVLGISFLGWSVKEMIFLYWIETVVICAFSTIYVLIAYDYTADVVDINRKRAALDEPPITDVNSTGMRVRGALGSAVYFGILCTISGAILFNVLQIKVPVGVVFRELLKETGMLLVIFGFLAYHAYVFALHFRDHMLARPTYRVLGLIAVMVVLSATIRFSGFAAFLLFVPIVIAKICFERLMLRFEHGEAANRHAARAQAASLLTLAPAASAQRNVRPLAHYMGAWRLAPGQRETPGWFAGAEFYNDAGKLRMRLADHAGPGDAPDVLESVNLRGSAERIEFVEVRLKSAGTRRILRFTASGTDPDGLELSETQYPEGDMEAMEARSLALQRRGPESAR